MALDLPRFPVGARGGEQIRDGFLDRGSVTRMATVQQPRHNRKVRPIFTAIALHDDLQNPHLLPLCRLVRGDPGVELIGHLSIQPRVLVIANAPVP